MRMPFKEIVDYDYVQEALIYDKESGLLTWRHRPLSHFVSDNAAAAWNSKMAGKLAGSRNFAERNNDYVRLTLNATSHLAHRVAWLLVHGEWPADLLDHDNGKKYDNRWQNIRLASFTENMWNRPAHRDNVSGYKGVSLHDGSWRARISVNGIEHNLGRFSSAEIAHRAYREAALNFHKEFAKT